MLKRRHREPAQASHSDHATTGTANHRRHLRSNSGSSYFPPFRPTHSRHNSGSMFPFTPVGPSHNSAGDGRQEMPPAPPHSQEESSTKGYDFSLHFNMFSPFTSNLALEFAPQPVEEEEEEVPESVPPPVWCMDVWNNVIALGCSNGQVEVYTYKPGLYYDM